MQFNSFQLCLLNGKSTKMNLCALSEYANTTLKCKKKLDVVYTDCGKAFDRVNHDIFHIRFQFFFEVL